MRRCRSDSIDLESRELRILRPFASCIAAFITASLADRMASGRDSRTEFKSLIDFCFSEARRIKYVSVSSLEMASATSALLPGPNCLTLAALGSLCLSSSSILKGKRASSSVLPPRTVAFA
uniref:Uncharacterized protein n=1 Tax=Pelagomonas calceolata TaxID=35677 RepID=A0A7S4E4C4_9STRA